MKLSIYNNISEYIKQHIVLFNLFDNVYLFGSTLNTNNPKDIDLLLIYSNYSNKAINDLNLTSSTLYETLMLPVDLTVLSIDELKETDFLKRIVNYLKLK